MIRWPGFTPAGMRTLTARSRRSAPLRDQLLVVLEKEGLSRLDSDGAEFDPTVHEAVAHEPAEGDEAGPVVNETMRAGYTWQGQLLRAAMVKVKG